MSAQPLPPGGAPAGGISDIQRQRQSLTIQDGQKAKESRNNQPTMSSQRKAPPPSIHPHRRKAKKALTRAVFCAIMQIEKINRPPQRLKQARNGFEQFPAGCSFPFALRGIDVCVPRHLCRAFSAQGTCPALAGWLSATAIGRMALAGAGGGQVTAKPFRHRHRNRGIRWNTRLLY